MATNKKPRSGSIDPEVAKLAADPDALLCAALALSGPVSRLLHLGALADDALWERLSPKLGLLLLACADEREPGAALVAAAKGRKRFAERLGPLLGSPLGEAFIDACEVQPRLASLLSVAQALAHAGPLVDSAPFLALFASRCSAAIACHTVAEPLCIGFSKAGAAMEGACAELVDGILSRAADASAAWEGPAAGRLPVAGGSLLSGPTAACARRLAGLGRSPTPEAAFLVFMGSVMSLSDQGEPDPPGAAVALFAELGWLGPERSAAIAGKMAASRAPGMAEARQALLAAAEAVQIAQAAKAAAPAGAQAAEPRQAPRL